MNQEAFQKNRTGKLGEISLPENDWAFVPNPLPPDWPFPDRLWPLVVRAKEELARLDGVGRTLTSPTLLLRPLQKREALRSSSLEGTYASPEELLLFELRRKTARLESSGFSPVLEVSNYASALEQGVRLLGELPLSLRFIRELHRTLLSGVRGREGTPGEFRKFQVHVGSDRRYIPPPASYVSACLDNFEQSMNLNQLNYDPLVWAFLMHYQLEAIHPFRDGNGRIGRLTLALMIFDWCRLHQPWLYMSSFFERNKDEYLDRLFRVSSHGDWEGWVEFCLRGTVIQAEDSIERCDALRTLKDAKKEKVDGLILPMN